MSFTAHWKETTGFNVEDYPVVIGKQLNQCTAEELLAHPMCGSVSLFANISYVMKTSDLGYSSVAMHLTGGAQWKEPIIGSQSATWVCEPAQTGDDAKIYRRSVFVAWKSSVTIPQYSIDDTCDNDIYIVDDIKDPNKLVFDTTGSTDFGHGDGAAITARIGALSLKHTCQKHQSNYASAPSQVVYEDPNTHVVTQYNIGLVYAYVIGTEVFLCCKDHLGVFGGRYQNANNQYNFLSGGNDYKSFKSANNYRLFLGQNVNGLNREATLGEIWPDCYPDPLPNPAVFKNGNQYYATPTTILPYQLEFRYTMQNSTISSYLASRSLYIGLSETTALEARKQQIARAGVYFVYDSTLLKPIIENGIVVNYGTPEDESEIDTYTDLNHPVPTGPGGGPTPPFPEGDEWDEINRGPVGVGGAGLLKVYAMSLNELASFSNWLNSVDSGSGYDGPPEGFNVIDSLIGLSQYPVDFTGGTPTTLVFTNSNADSENRVVNSHCSANRLSGVGTTQHYSLGSITIDKKFAGDTQFLDYDTLVEVYVPFCGIFTVDTQVVMGRTLSGDIWVDPVTGGCYAEIDCSLDTGGVTPIIMAEGNMGIEMPITSTQYSMSIAAQATNRNSYIAGAIGSAIGAVVTAVAGGMAAGYKGVSDTFNAAVAAGSPAGGASASTFGIGFRQGFAENLGRQGISALSAATSGTYNAYRTNKLLQAANNTAVKGGLGSSFAVWAQPWEAYVKITRYNKQVPGNYNHTIGVPVVMDKTLAAYSSGDYIVCVNPDLSGFSGATPDELSQIYTALTSGVYV